MALHRLVLDEPVEPAEDSSSSLKEPGTPRTPVSRTNVSDESKV